jgi:hypothetical protein
MIFIAGAFGGGVLLVIGWSNERGVGLVIMNESLHVPHMVMTSKVNLHSAPGRPVESNRRGIVNKMGQVVIIAQLVRE